MSFRQGFFIVRDLGIDALPEALLAAASHAPASAGTERFLLDEDMGWSAASLVDELAHAHRWAQAVSLERSAVAVSFFIFEGTWSYAIFDAGEHVIGMEFFPHERPLLQGDASRAAALLGCSVEIFPRYHEAILAACELGETFEDEYPRAYEDDEYEAADEYGFEDFARRAGVPCDFPFDSDPVGVHAAGIRPTTWIDLPPLP